MSNPNFDTLVSHTLKNYRGQLADNITNHQVLWLQMKERGFIREDEGGTSIVETLLVERNTTVSSYSGYDIIDTSPQGGFTAAEFDWKQIAGSVTISGEEEFKNSGSKTKVINLLQSKITQLELSMMLEINRQLQADGTGNGGKDITGLGLAVEDGASFSTYGGINSSTFPYWRNQWLSDVAITSSTDFASYMSGLRTLYNSCSRGKVKPTIIISDQYLFERYEAALVPNERFMDMRLGDAGFLNLMFKATPWVFDDDMPGASLTVGASSDNHELVMLNADFLKFVMGKGKNFVVTDFQRPENQDAKVSQILLYGNLTCSNRQRQGRMNVDTTA
jgi:hypothetical protein